MWDVKNSFIYCRVLNTNLSSLNEYHIQKKSLSGYHQVAWICHLILMDILDTKYPRSASSSIVRLVHFAHLTRSLWTSMKVFNHPDEQDRRFFFRLCSQWMQLQLSLLGGI
jgi:hypothetical protein